MAAPRLLVVMLNWNASAMTLGGLDDLLGWEYPLDRVTLLVHDNASKDGDWEAVAERVAALDGRRGLRAVFRRFAAHPGVTASFNAALAEAASADYVVRLDNDVRLDPQAAGRLVAFMEANPTAGVCAPLLRVGGPEGPPLSGPVRFDPARGSICLPVTGAVPVACDLVDGAVMLARRVALDGLGHWF
ncbi:MAG: glycosyltransferase, partial [Alphaproteobacteria bacterium]|nr:glycosyltransferase [Alphaproteobacteria bacterium]